MRTGSVRATEEHVVDKASQRRIVRARRLRLLKTASPILFLLLWEAAVRLGALDGKFFPAPSRIALTAWDMVLSGELQKDLSISLMRICIGLLIGAVPGIALGLAMGLWAPVRAAVEPLISALYPIPKLALLPLILLVFGLGEASKFATIALGVFFTVLIETMAGVLEVDQIYYDVAKNFGARGLQSYLTVALPGALPSIMTGVKLGIGMALLLIVAAEMIAAQGGIGFLIWTSYQVWQIPQMYVGFALMSLLGYIFITLVDVAARRLVPWKGEH